MAYYGNAPADVALVVGSDVITTTEIQDATIATADIANDAITAVKIDDDGTGFQMGSLGLGTAVSGSEKLTVGGTASFADDISLTSGKSITSGNMKMYIDVDAHSTSASYATFEALSDRGIDIRSQSQTRFYTDNANTLALTLDSSQNATVAGKAWFNGGNTSATVGIKSHTNGWDGGIRITDSNNASYVRLHQDTNTAYGFMIGDSKVYIQNGVGINAVAGTHHLNVGGTANFSGSLTGTSATFAEGVTINDTDGSILAVNTTDSEGGYIIFQRSGTAKGYIGSSAKLINGASNDDLTLRAENNLQFSIGSTEAVKIDSSRNTEFSGIVKATKSFSASMDNSNGTNTGWVDDNEVNSWTISDFNVNGGTHFNCNVVIYVYRVPATCIIAVDNHSSHNRGAIITSGGTSSSGGSSFTLTMSSTVPTGTTGADGSHNIFIQRHDDSSPKISIENRTGTAQQYRITVMNTEY